MEGKRLRSGKLFGAKVAASDLAEQPEASAFATLPSELLRRILGLALEDDATSSRASCKLVCREWRDHLRSGATRLVIGGAGKYTSLGRALQNNPHIVDLAVWNGHGDLKGRVSAQKYDVLSGRAWSNVTLCPNNGSQRGPNSLATFLAASHDSLTSLTLGDVSLDVVDFAQALMGSASLRKLVLQRTCLTAPGITALLESLNPMTGLKEIQLEALFDDTRGGLLHEMNDRTLAVLPSRFPNLETLSLRAFLFTRFSDEAYVSLLKGLLVLTTLRMEFLEFRRLDTVPAIVAQHSPQLRELSLSAWGKSYSPNASSHIFGSGVTAVLEQCSSLSTLRLPRMPLTLEKGWPMLLGKMRNIEALECCLSDCDPLLLGTLVKLRHLTLTNYCDDLGLVARAVKHLPHFSKLILDQTLKPQQARSLQAVLPGVTLEYGRPST